MQSGPTHKLQETEERGEREKHAGELQERGRHLSECAKFRCVAGALVGGWMHGWIEGYGDVASGSKLWAQALLQNGQQHLVSNVKVITRASDDEDARYPAGCEGTNLCEEGRDRLFVLGN